MIGGKFYKMWPFVLSVVAIVQLNFASSNEQNDTVDEARLPYKVMMLRIHDTLTKHADAEYTDKVKKDEVTSSSNITFELYTKGSKTPVLIPGNDPDSVGFPDFDIRRKSVFIIHGWKADSEGNCNVIIRRAIFEVHDVNLFEVDWSNIAKKPYRIAAKNSVRSVGACIGNFIGFLFEKYNLNPSDVIMIGHSLGAHAAGLAGARIIDLHDKLVDSIIALDPARPRFTSNNARTRLHVFHAQFVHVIHTNAGFLALDKAIGDADYYPNGGHLQPGCGLDLIGVCSHSRSYKYFAESISKSKFLARKCESYSSYLTGICDENDSSYMGGLFVDKSANGSYYVATNLDSPYAMMNISIV